MRKCMFKGIVSVRRCAVVWTLAYRNYLGILVGQSNYCAQCNSSAAGLIQLSLLSVDLFWFTGKYMFPLDFVKEYVWTMRTLSFLSNYTITRPLGSFCYTNTVGGPIYRTNLHNLWCLLGLLPWYRHPSWANRLYVWHWEIWWKLCIYILGRRVEWLMHSGSSMFHKKVT